MYALRVGLNEHKLNNLGNDAMRAYIAIKYHEDGRNRHTIQKISSAFEKTGFETVCIFRDIEEWGQVHLDPVELMKRTFECIDSSDIVVIDLTEKGVGLGIEAGYAFANKIPVITIAHDGADISTTLEGISQKIYIYTDLDDLTEFFSDLRIGAKNGLH